jgi:hypothetical protein
MEKFTFTRVNLSDVRVITAIMHVHVEVLLCCQVRVGACGHDLLYQALNPATSGGPWSSGGYLALGRPRLRLSGPGYMLSRVTNMAYSG